MWFGMNSLEDNPNIHQITYQEMIEEMLSKEITPILLTTSPTCSAFTSRDFSYLQNIVQIDKNLANHYDGVYLIDVREELNKVIGSNCANYFSDGYHINPEGHNQFANIVVNQFTEWKNNNEGPFSCQ
jgi:lysophospholipase L1-like esterase